MQVKCMQCLHESNRYENMMDLAVEIQGNIESLEDALAQFTAPEKLQGDNKYKCDRFVPPLYWSPLISDHTGVAMVVWKRVFLLFRHLELYLEQIVSRSSIRWPTYSLPFTAPEIGCFLGVPGHNKVWCADRGGASASIQVEVSICCDVSGLPLLTKRMESKSLSTKFSGKE